MPFLLIALLLLTLWPQGGEVGRLNHPAIRESSGLVASRKHPGVFWTHNDSGNPPRLFAVQADGSLIREYAVSVPNVDWEDIATDDQGRLYIGDIGNNGGRLPLRAVYRVDEPDPSAKTAEPVPVLAVNSAAFYRFEADDRFDAEGLVVTPEGTEALIVAKTFDGRDAPVYSLSLSPPAPLLRPATPRKVGTLPGFTAPVTGADLRKNGLLVVTSLNAVGVYRKDKDGQWRRVGGRTFKGGGVEAVAWDGDDLLLTSEGRSVYRIKAADWHDD